MQRKFDINADVVENICLTGKYFRIRVFAPEIAAAAHPGQFCMIRPEHSGESLLRRPFSIAAVRNQEILEFAYTSIGRGTRYLSALKEKQRLLCLGPLGNSFPIISDRKALVVTGGIGMAPFPFLNRILNENGIFPATYYGARTATELIYLEELNQLSERLILATDDGTTGFHGFVTEIFESELETLEDPAVIYACGPHPMMRRVKSLAEKWNIPAYLSMEEIMGCGIGICIGCPIPAYTPEGAETYQLCCKEGPIFPSSILRL